MSELGPLRRRTGDAALALWERVSDWATIRPTSRRARRFLAFGEGSAICFPIGALFGERHIRIGAATVIGPNASLSAGVSPWQDLGTAEVVTIGDGCLIGKGAGIVGHERIVIGNGVFTGHYVYITDANHGYEDTTLPVGKQFGPSKPVHIGDGAWLGHGAVVLPGASIGCNVVVGAGSVVTGDIPAYSVAVGNPARVIRRYVDGQGWIEPTGPAETPATEGNATEGNA